MNKLVFFALTLIVGIGLFIVVISNVGINKITDIILTLKIWHFAVLIALYGISFLISTYRWKIILNATGHTAPFRKILAARMAGQAINYLTPSGLIMGEPFKAMVLASENNMRMGSAMVSVVVEGAIFLSTLLLVVIIGVFSFITYSAISQKTTLIIFGALAFLLVIFYLFYAKMIKRSAKEANEKGFFTYLIDLLRLNKISFVNNLRERIAKREGDVRNFFISHRKIVMLSILLSLAEIVVMLTAHWLAIFFLGHTLNLRTLLGVFSLMSISNILPLPGSLGGFELSQMFAFSFFNLGGQVTALAFSMITRIISLLYVVIGIIYLIHFEAKLMSGKIIEFLPKFKEKIRRLIKNI